MSTGRRGADCMQSDAAHKKRMSIRSASVAALMLMLSVSPSGAQAPAASDTPAPPDITLTLDQARALAVRAAVEGQPRAVLQLAGGLLQADPRDSMAHFLIAGAHGMLGQPAAGRKSAARAFRYAQTQGRRFEAAELAARLSYVEKRPTLTQLWLRRAIQSAPNDQVERQLGKDYARVRAENPFSFSLRGGLRPSSNINNGADSALQIIEGVPVTGVLSGSAQALSGLIAQGDLSLRYRLRGDAKSLTSVAGRLYVQRVMLSEEAKDLSPTSRNDDFGYTYAEVSLDHAFATKDDGGSARIGAAAGRLWSGGTSAYDFARVTAGRSWKLAPDVRLTFSGSAEMRHAIDPRRQDNQRFSLTGAVQHTLADGGRVQLSLNLQDVRSDFVNDRSTGGSLRATYAFARQIGPAVVTAGVTAGYQDYPDYVAFVKVPGGRQDRSIYADVSLFFPDYDYAGFAPTVTMTTGRKSSNVSRFDTRELSISLGIESKF